MYDREQIGQYVSQWALAEHLNENLRRNLRFVQMEADETIVIAKDVNAKVYFLVSGSVAVMYNHLNGKQSAIGSMRPLALIGELDLFYEPNLELVIVTQERSDFLYLEKDVALEYGRDDPNFLRLIIEDLSKKLTESGFILKHNVLPLMGQLASYLLAKGEAGERPLLMPSRAYLAELLGTTTRHLNRVFNKLTDEKIIAIDGSKIIILNAAALQLLAES